MHEAGTIDNGPHIKIAFGAILLAMLVAGIAFYLTQKRAMQETVEDDLLTIAHLKANQISVWRKDQLNGAGAIQQHPFLIESVASFLNDPGRGNEQNLRTHLHNLARQHGYADILLVDPEGEELLSLTGPLHQIGRYAAELARALQTQIPQFIDLHVNANVPTPHISTIAPLFLNTGPTPKPMGALILICDASQFLYPLLEFWPTTSNTAETLIVRKESDHIVFLNDLRHQPDTALKLRISLHRTDVPAVSAALGGQGVMLGNDYRGAEVVAAILPIADSPWFLVGKIDVEEAYAQWHSRSALLLALLLGLAALFGLTVMVMRQREKKAHYRALYLSEAALRANVEHHSITLKAIGDAVIATDPRGRVKLINPVAERLTGWKEADAHGRPLEEIFRIVNEQTREKVESPAAKVLQAGEIVGLANHTILIARDGTERPIADSGSPIRNENGDIIGVVLVFRDQTLERDAAAKLAARERYFRSMIINLHEDILVIDRHYSIADINNTALLTLGRKHADVVGRKCFDISHGLNSPCHEHGEHCPLVEVFATGKPSNCRHVHVKSDGTQAHIDIIMSPLKNEEGQVTHVVEAARDITDVLRTRRALQRSEEKFRAIFEHMGPACTLDEIVYNNGKAVDYRVLDVNPAYEHLIGISKGRAIGSLASELYHSNEATSIEILAEIDATGAPASSESFFPATGKYMQITTSKISSGRLCTLFSDITQRRRAEKERIRLLSAIEQAGEMVVITDPEGQIQYVNPAFEQTSGYLSEEVVGHTPSILKSGKQSLSFYRDMWETISSGRTWGGRMINMRKDGTLYTEDSTISPVCDDSGRILNYVAVKRDVTEHLRLEAHFQQAQKMEAIGQLAGGIAHDFNNILSAISGYTELSITMLEPESKTFEYLTQVLEASGRAKELVNQILMFSRETTQEVRPIRIDSPVKEALKLIRASVQATIEIRLKIRSTASALADPTQIHQIVMNLCTNAAQAMQESGGCLEVHLTDIRIDDEERHPSYPDAKPGAYIRLMVSDQGDGIDAQYLHRIYEPFFTTKKRGEGTGMGLSVVHGIVKSYGGYIYAHSRLGQGSMFEILFPSRESAALPDAILEAPTPRGSESILYVDDEIMIVDIAKRMLESLGYRVVAKTNALEALETFANAPDSFDLVVTDMTMPKMTGLDLAERLLRIRPGFPIVLCTGFDLAMNEEKMALYGLCDIIHKPILRIDMATVIRNTLDNR
jgi:PAS domain S-box-containing protein